MAYTIRVPEWAANIANLAADEFSGHYNYWNEDNISAFKFNEETNLSHLLEACQVPFIAKKDNKVFGAIREWVYFDGVSPNALRANERKLDADDIQELIEVYESNNIQFIKDQLKIYRERSLPPAGLDLNKIQPTSWNKLTMAILNNDTDAIDDLMQQPDDLLVNSIKQGRLQLFANNTPSHCLKPALADLTNIAQHVIGEPGEINHQLLSANSIGWGLALILQNKINNESLPKAINLLYPKGGELAFYERLISDIESMDMTQQIIATKSLFSVDVLPIERTLIARLIKVTELIPEHPHPEILTTLKSELLKAKAESISSSSKSVCGIRI